jgi:hypothetical protein
MKHESEFHDDLCFVTLTYDYCKRDPVLSKSDLQKFLKRLRINSVRAGFKVKIRYFGAGEYGSKTWRPHYHLILFGVGTQHIDIIEKSWQFGYVYTLPVKDGGCEYVAKYCVKTDAREFPAHWQRPFALFSEGLGKAWCDKHARFLADPEYAYFGQVLCGDYHVSMPKYYQRRLFTESLKLQFQQKYGKISSSDLKSISPDLNVAMIKYLKDKEDIARVVSSIQAQNYVAKANLIGGSL